MRIPELRELSLIGFSLFLVAVVTGCSSSNDEFFRTSAHLLEIDNSWTDITTYQEKHSGLVDISSEVNFGGRFQRSGYIRSNGGTLENLRFEQDLLAVPEELSGIKHALSTLYMEELSAFLVDDWRPQQNYRNAPEYVDEYGPIEKYSQSLSQKYYFGPWFEAQLRRGIIYEKWLTLLEEMGADATTILEYETAMNKQ